MEEALVLLNESHNYWVNGDLENALEMLDQAYALLLDTNGNPDIARQKDDLRLMISKRILSIYNSLQTVAKGKRSEIPVITNADVEKEIRQFQTVEREFFISSYQRSAMYRPIILRELKKAGLPEELAWLPLVESGFKISALSSCTGAWSMAIYPFDRLQIWPEPGRLGGRTNGYRKIYPGGHRLSQRTSYDVWGLVDGSCGIQLR